MSGARTTIDGLWRCLCPSIDAATFTRAVSTPYRPRRPSRADTKRRTCRLLHTTDLAPPLPPTTKTPSSSKPPTVANSTDNVQKLLKITFPFEVPADVTTMDVTEALRFTRNLQRPRWKTITAKLVEHLLAKGVPPNTFIYETLLMAQSSLEGSANAVSSLLGEMRKKKIPWSSTAYHSALRACAPLFLVARHQSQQLIHVGCRHSRFIPIIWSGSMFCAR